MELDAALSHARREICEVKLLTSVALKFSCIICSAVFGSSRALATHTRTAHKQRSGLRCFLDASAICPVCKTQFGSRIRCLAHVSERRKRGASQTQALSCRERLERGDVVPLEPSLLDSLDEIDRKLRADARRAGRAQPLVLVKASRTKVRGQPDAHKGGVAKQGGSPCPLTKTGDREHRQRSWSIQLLVRIMWFPLLYEAATF